MMGTQATATHNSTHARNRHGRLNLETNTDAQAAPKASPRKKQTNTLTVDSVLAPRRSIIRRVHRIWCPNAASPVSVNTNFASRRSASLEIGAGFEYWPMQTDEGTPLSGLVRMIEGLFSPEQADLTG
jgi:hypothetical protein